MFDIIRCEADAKKHGFTSFYSFDSIKGRVIHAEGLAEAVKHKNRKSLIMLRDHAFDEGAIKVIGEKKKLCFLIDLSKIIKGKGVPRAIAISKLRNFLGMCVRFDAYYAFATFSDKEDGIRSPEELQNMLMLFGLNRGQGRFALQMLKHYL